MLQKESVSSVLFSLVDQLPDYSVPVTKMSPEEKLIHDLKISEESRSYFTLAAAETPASHENDTEDMKDEHPAEELLFSSQPR
jgi:hypothetical protein